MKGRREWAQLDVCNLCKISINFHFIPRLVAVMVRFISLCKITPKIEPFPCQNIELFFSYYEKRNGRTHILCLWPTLIHSQSVWYVYISFWLSGAFDSLMIVESEGRHGWTELKQI